MFMKKQYLFICICIAALHTSATLKAQTNTATDDMYIDYQKYFNDASKGFTKPKSLIPRNVKQLQDSAASLSDEGAPNVFIHAFASSSIQLSDEEIYAKRKNSVFIIGKLKKKDPVTGNLNFDFAATAFAITEDGICIANYHVLQSIIKKDDSTVAADSVYFIMTLGKKVYFLEKILAYSQNNDMVIFKVNTYGEKLNPIPIGVPAQVGSTVYCLSHPVGYFYYFSKGIVARNIVAAPQQAAAGYNPGGKPPVRMEITADYGIGSSGGPILDKYGNVVGMVCSTSPITYTGQDKNGNTFGHQQMVVKDAIPVKALTGLLNTKLKVAM